MVLFILYNNIDYKLNYINVISAATKKPSSPQAIKHRPADEGPPPYTQDGLDRRHMPPGGHREQPPFDKRLQNAAHSRSSPALNSRFFF